MNQKLKITRNLLLLTVLASSFAQADEIDFSSNMVSGQYQKCLIVALKPYMSMLKNNLIWADKTLGNSDASPNSSPEEVKTLNINTSQDRYIQSITGMKVTTDSNAANNNSKDGYTAFYYEIKFEDLKSSNIGKGNPCGILSNYHITLYPHYLNWSAQNAKADRKNVLLNGPAVFYMNTDIPGFSLQGEDNNGWNVEKAQGGACMLDNSNIALHNAFGIISTFNIGKSHNSKSDQLDPTVCAKSVINKSRG
jgi:hypothetical protein